MVTVGQLDVRNLKLVTKAVTINLPHFSAERAARGNPSLAGSECDTTMSRARKTILCIDDQWNALISRKMFLESHGYRVLETTGADEGLKLFRTCLVDAVILDYQLPGMNGDLVAAKMKRMKPHVPIVLLSVYGPLPESKLESVDTFLTNSQGPTVLLSVLQNLLNRRPKPFLVRWLDHWRGHNAGVVR